MENSFKNIIDRSSSILILLPLNPYFDQVAAGLSLYLALKDQKNAQIVSPTPITVEFNRLIGVNKISQDLGNRNLVIKFIDYKANDIERVSYDIEEGQFKLTVIPKAEANPPLKEQIDLSYSGILVDTVIVIGGANESHFPSISSQDFIDANFVHIGIKDISLTSGRSYLSFSKPASSISEVIFGLLKEAGINYDSDIATNLLMGIDESTQSLNSPSVNADTFSAISELMKTGGKRLNTQAPLERNNYPAGSIPGTQWGVQPTKRISQQQTQIRDNFTDTKEDENQNPPKDWLSPKIYKGTSTS